MSCKISWHNTTLMFHNVTITIRLFFSSEIRKDYTQFCPTFRFLCTATGKPPFTESVHVLKTKALIRAFPSEEPDSRVSSGASTCSCCGVCFISSFFSFLPCFFTLLKWCVSEVFSTKGFVVTPGCWDPTWPPGVAVCHPHRHHL